MKKWIFLFLVSHHLFVFSQKMDDLKKDNEFIISGKVTGSKFNNVLPGTEIMLVFSDSSVYNCIADSLGLYSVRKEINRETGCLISYIYPWEKGYGNCPFSYKNSTQYAHDRIVFTIYPDTLNKNIVKDIRLGEINIDYIFFNTMFFNKNTLQFSTDCKNYIQSDTTLDCIIDFLSIHPNYKINVMGYADKREKKAQELSEKRAEKIAGMLIKGGINRVNISIKGLGTLPPAKKEGYEYEADAKPCIINERVEITFYN